MAYKQVWLPLKIHNLVNICNVDGYWHAHLVIDEDDLSVLKKLTVYEAWDDVPSIFKDEDGGLLHEYLGWAEDKEVKDGELTKVIRVPPEADGY